MRTTWMTWTGCAFFALSSACDLTVDDGDVVVLSNDGLVLGSFPEPFVGRASAAARISGGTLVVENASLLGGNVRVSSQDQFSLPAPAIEANGGTLEIQSGLIRAGEIVFTRQLGLHVFGASGVTAFRTRIEMSGGTIAGGPAGEFLPAERNSGSAPGGVGLVVDDSDVLILGGVIRPGPGTSEAEAHFGRPFAATFFDSRFDIRGGDFRGGRVLQSGGSGRISGGRFQDVESVPGGGTCLEIRGGSLASLSVRGDAVFLFGTGFSQPLGVLGGGREGESLRLTGTLEDGTPLDLQLNVEADSSVTLARPGTRGCL